MKAAALIVPDYPVQEGQAAIIGFLNEVSGWLLSNFDRHVAYVSAWNARDAAAFADLFSDDGFDPSWAWCRPAGKS